MNRGLQTIACCLAVLASAAGSVFAQNPIPPSPATLLPKATPPPVEAVSATPAISAAQPSSFAAQAAIQMANAAASGDYVLSPADTVEMTVFHEPDLNTQARIANDGSVQLPLLGDLKIAGMPVRDARELIRKRYNADYLVEPQVYLNVVAFAERKFTILGQVAKPGTYPFPGGEHLSLLEAVGMAGDFTRLADRGSVSVKRTDRGGQQTLKVNTKQLTRKGGKDFAVQPDDVITVGESWF
jgi:protein involved in polysaccharide export with SLBB domain